jgi:FMN phosphatase YigB (HAD superfamily)
VGDDPRWDIEGAAAVSMPAILVDRESRYAGQQTPAVGDLQGALSWISSRR